MDIEEIAHFIVDSALKVHRQFGPGLLESEYQTCLAYELNKLGLKVQCEVTLPIRYDDQWIESGYRIDMLIENLIIVENKTVAQIQPIHEAQMLTYLRLKGCWLGFIINWNVRMLKFSIRRIVTGDKEKPGSVYEPSH